jgi:hypothetical protein
MKLPLFLSVNALALAFLSGCATQNSTVLAQYPPSHGRVFVTEESLPPDVPFVMIATIDVGKKWYGSSHDAVTATADRARELGANAVIQSKTWLAPSGFSWAAPHGSGQAVKISDMKALEASSVRGTWH